jgi:CYTH domain-containing protein
VFQSAAAGLVLAEVELERVDQAIVFPEWARAEFTYDPRYRNASIAALGLPE